MQVRFDMLKPIRSEEDYAKALERIDALMDMDETQEILDELEILSILVEKYEDEHFPIDAPSPVEAIRFRMEQQGLTNKDLAEYLGGANRVSEVFSGKRTLSLRMIKRLHENLNIPYEVLM